MSKFITGLALFAISASGTAFAQVTQNSELTWKNTHAYMHEFHESTVTFTHQPGGAYREVFKCLCSSSTLDDGNHTVSVGISGMDETRLFGPEKYSVIAKNPGAMYDTSVGTNFRGLQATNTNIANTAPNAGNAASEPNRFLMNMDAGAMGTNGTTNNFAFDRSSPVPHALLVTKAGNDSYPVASMQMRVLNAQYAPEGVEKTQTLNEGHSLFNVPSENAAFDSRASSPSSTIKWESKDDTSPNQNGQVASWDYADKGATAMWTDGTFVKPGSFESGSSAKVSHTGELRVINNSAKHPFTPNASGTCNANADFDSYSVAKQACGDHKILAIAVTMHGAEMAATYKVRITVKAESSASHYET